MIRKKCTCRQADTTSRRLQDDLPLAAAYAAACTSAAAAILTAAAAAAALPVIAAAVAAACCRAAIRRLRRGCRQGHHPQPLRLLRLRNVPWPHVWESRQRCGGGAGRPGAAVPLQRVPAGRWRGSTTAQQSAWCGGGLWTDCWLSVCTLADT